METITLTQDQLLDMMETVSQKAAIETISMLGAGRTIVTVAEAGRIFGLRKVQSLIEKRIIKSKQDGRYIMVDLSEIRNHLKPKEK